MPKKTMKADMVEAYLKHMIEMAQQKNVPAKIKRMQIAERMQCTPNLVSYVIHQRLNKNREYLVKAQRGIGGCIEIMNRDQTEEDLLEPQLMTSKRAQQIRKRIENNVNTYIQQEIKPIQKEIGLDDTTLAIISCISQKLLENCREENDTFVLDLVKDGVRDAIKQRRKQ